jgi:hypothetical protein
MHRRQYNKATRTRLCSGSLVQRQIPEFTARWTECCNAAVWRTGIIDLRVQIVHLINQKELSRYGDSLRDGRSGDRIPVAAKLSALVQTVPGVHPASSTMCTGSLSLEVKWPGSGVDHPLPSSVEVKGRVELYLYSPPGLHGPVLGWTVSCDIFSPNSFYLHVYVCMYIGFKMFFYVVRHVDSIASYLPTDLYLHVFGLYIFLHFSLQYFPFIFAICLMMATHQPKREPRYIW